MERDLTAFRPTRLWKRLPPEKRASMADLFWRDEQSTEQQIEAVAAIAAHMKFRAKSVFGLSTEKRARYLAALPSISETIAARALITYHLETQRPMMGAFLDSLGIAHENGLISEETVARPDAARLREAATDLAGKFPADDVSLYLSTLVSQDPDTWGDLAELPETVAAVTS